MAQSVSKQFRAALTHLLAHEGRGAQTRLAIQQGIDRGYLNAIVKGRKPGSDGIRGKITTHFKMDYEDMLALGRRLLEEQGGLVSGKGKVMEKTVTEKREVEENVSEGNISLKLQKGGGEGSNVSLKIVKVIEILESGTSYGDLLVGLIDTFHESIKINEVNLTSRNRMMTLESKIAYLEGRLEEAEKHIKKSA
jgi:hypothetical protein